MKENILYIDDEIFNLEGLKLSFYDDYNIFTASSTTEAREILAHNPIKVVITDQRMPRETGIEFIEDVSSTYPEIVFMILSGFADFNVAKDAIRTGKVYRFLEKPWKEEQLVQDINSAIEKYNLVERNKNLLIELEQHNEELKVLKHRLEEENVYLKGEIKQIHNFENIISKDKKFLGVLRSIEHVADSDASVLILGETGTGKELIAKSIHNLSKRRDYTFVGVNCAAIPEALFESELFGHEKGAFTGAISQRKGKFELADNGTLFLDEIGELPLDLQTKLLRVIQEGEIERVGGSKTIKVNNRIIAATNRDLEKDVENGKFRSDLYYRLNVFPTKIPPLRDRLGDISVLSNFFIRRFNKKYSKKIKSISKKNMDRLKQYPWPGNIRELENVIERSVLISDSMYLDIDSCLFSNHNPDKEFKFETLQENEKKYITRALDKTNWQIGGETGAAKLLGLNRTTLIAKMKKLDISR